ncbi:MAG: hypothetical protein HY718_11660 [Planctomycetes bacterium]|nr:hypothetical protein [Planctomycetota bacterium]
MARECFERLRAALDRVTGQEMPGTDPEVIERYRRWWKKNETQFVRASRTSGTVGETVRDE